MGEITFSDERTLTFWLPPSNGSTHVGITWGKGDPIIYINGHIQDWKAEHRAIVEMMRKEDEAIAEMYRKEATHPKDSKIKGKE